MFNLINAGVWDNITSALTSESLWGAIAKSLIIILLGFFLTKKGIFKDNMPKVLTTIVLVIALPCLAFTGFMSNITAASFKSAIFSFIWGFVIYTLFIFLAKLLFCKVDSKKRTVLEILFVFGSTTFFGQPIVNAIFGDAATLDSNMFNIAYRVFLYSYAFIVISTLAQKEKEKESATAISKTDSEGTEVVAQEAKPAAKLDVKDVLKKIFVNPIVIATLAGFVLWSAQLLFENVGFMKVDVDGTLYHFWRIDKTLNPIYATMTTIGGLASPLVWLAIGGTLATIPFKEAAADKTAWFYSILKIFVAPTVNLVLLLILNMFFDINFTIIAASTIMWATPPATVAVSYCINFDTEAVLASNCSLLGTIVAVVGIPVWVIILTVIESVLFTTTASADTIAQLLSMFL